jgi:hypothetical protein
MQIRALILTSLAWLTASPACLSGPIDPAQAIAQKFYEADQPAPPPVAKLPARPGHDYEMDMLRRARAEETERQKEEDTQKAVLLKAATSQAQVIPVTTTHPAEKNERQQAEIQKAVPPKAVAAPARMIPAVNIQPAPEPLPKPLPEPNPLLIEPAAAPQMPPAKPLQYAIAQPDPEPSTPSRQTRATVLIVLDTDNNEARVKPDPIICFDQQCWISNGLEAPAKPVPRTVAVAMKTTESATGDSCTGKSGCAFRDIAFDPTNRVQVVEVGESRGVAGQAYTVAADTSCRKHEGDLTCTNALVTHGYRMWVVPENTAEAVGPSGLEEAVVEGLQDDGENSDDGK